MTESTPSLPGDADSGWNDWHDKPEWPSPKLDTTGKWPTWVVRLRLLSPVRWRLGWQGRRRWSTWHVAPATSTIQQCRCHDKGSDIMKIMIPAGYNITTYWYQQRYQRCYRMISTYDIRTNWYHSHNHMICIWYRRQYHTRIAQERLFLIAFYDIIYDIMEKNDFIYDIIYDIILSGQYHVAQERLKTPSYMISYMIS